MFIFSGCSGLVAYVDFEALRKLSRLKEADKGVKGAVGERAERFHSYPKETLCKAFLLGQILAQNLLQSHNLLGEKTVHCVVGGNKFKGPHKVHMIQA